ncbi:hypothetical protein Tco_1145151 [Tanacetum coccineum]
MSKNLYEYNVAITDEEKLLAQKAKVKWLNQTEAEYWVRDITDAEIKEVIFGIGDEKAPGADRFTIIQHFKYHWRCKELKLTQLYFADDLLMLCNGDYKYVEILKEDIMEISNISGLAPNMSKITIFFGSVKAIEKHRILEMMHFLCWKAPYEIFRNEYWLLNEFIHCAKRDLKLD